MCNNTIPIVKLSSWKIQDEWTKASSCSLWFLSSSGQAPQGVTNHPQIEVSGRRRQQSLWGGGGHIYLRKKSDGFMASTTPSIALKRLDLWLLNSTWNLGSHSFEYTYCCCWCCSSAMLPALQVSCLMCFVPQLIERNLYADDRFIPTDWSRVA